MCFGGDCKPPKNNLSGQPQFFPHKDHTLVCRKHLNRPLEQMRAILVSKGWSGVRNHQHLNKATLSKTNIYQTGNHQLTICFSVPRDGPLWWELCLRFDSSSLNVLIALNLGKCRAVRTEHCSNLVIKCHFSRKNPKHLWVPASQM